MLEKEAAKAKKLGKGVISLITFAVILAAAFQIHRLSRASLNRAVTKYSTSDAPNTNVLDRSTADAPPPKEALPDNGSPDAPANGDGAPGAGAEPNAADAPGEQ